ncbi:phosphatidate cytidylyltransferase [Tatumella sp. TA1]|uniref:phosphatidate cytidylyltransferase n=1 Tax=Rosenbergiella collisarenosi TaxID=1544695 RepID=UPI0008F7F822|nr:phosphatidate cytidylyltransferase [Rosenbergiella collisarenosi]MBT0720157.1 phosphatidate cytidylyltransferase [Rosenbergiella collisarenosi]QGX92207.1 phosphatidate cytidylyltransferase [Tatumella sp. TA1]
MLKSRLLTAIILIPLVIAALFFLPANGFILVVLAITMLAAWEWGQFAGLKTPLQRILLALVFGLLLAGMVFMLPPYQRDIHQPYVALSLWVSLSWWCVALLMVLAYPKSKMLWDRSRFLPLVFGALTLVPFFWGMLVLRQYHYDFDRFAGAWWLLFVLLLVWGADSGAYLFGKLFGRHKLAPKVSPGKTIEGCLGGLATSALIAWIFAYFAPLNVAPMSLICAAVIATLASILGDLTESMFKRASGIKDSGNLIPGHGGILDRIDSLTAAVPVFTCVLLLVFQVK